METKLRKRHEIKLEDTWDMSDLLQDDAAWEALFASTKEEIGEYKNYRGTLSESPERLSGCLAFDSRCSLHLEILYVYARQCLDQDTNNQKYQDFADRARFLNNKSAELSAYLVPEILSIESEKMSRWLADSPELRSYDRTLELILRQKDHTLSQEMEELLARSLEATESPQQIFTMFNNADLKFPMIGKADGSQVRLTHGNFTAFLKDGDRAVRQQAFQAMYQVFGQFKNTVAAVFGANLKQASFYARARHYESTLNYYLDQNEIPAAVYDNLVTTVRNHLHLQHRYMKLRKRMLGLKELHMYDLYVPLVEDFDGTYSFEEAKAMVAEGLSPLGEEYIGYLREGFENRWIDVYENEGKRSGAYSWGAYGSHPYVLLNYNGMLDQVFTLAHEMGHALHSHYSDGNQPYQYAGYKIFVAEVASTCNEALLIRHLLAGTEDRKKKAGLINYFLENFRATVFRQTMFAEFERMVHDMTGRGESLTADTLCQMYRQLNRDYFGEDVVIDEEIGYEWERIPHFYTPFYVYQYATGFSAASAISSRILAGDQGTLRGYFEFLKGGCSKTPIELLKLCGIDMTQGQPVMEAMSLFEALLDELEKVWGE